MKTEKLTENNAYFCENCKRKNDSLKRMSIHKLPEVLILHLKRFKHDGGYYGGSKISKTVTFPVSSDFDLSPYLSPGQTGGGNSYRLSGFTVHMGSLTGGHYIAYCRHKTTGQWLCFDDSRVSIVTDLSIIESAEPYVLFFQRVPDKAIIKERKMIKDATPIGNDAGLWLPRRWICAVKSMGIIPPIYNRDIVCPHMHPSSMSKEMISSQFQFVQPPELASRLINRYGVLDLTCDMVSVDICRECELWIGEYNNRLAVEHKLVTALDTKGIEVGEYWYFLDAKWVAAWRVYLRAGQITDRNKACNPGMIDNTELAKKLSEKSLAVKMSSDFVAVNRKVWTVFVHCHGLNGPVIRRDSLDPATSKSPPAGELVDVPIAQVVGTLVDEPGLERIFHAKFSQ